MPDYLLVVGRFTTRGDMYDVMATTRRSVDHSDIVPIRPGDDVRDVVGVTLEQLRERFKLDGGEPITVTPLYAPAAEPVRVEDLTEVIASLDIVNGRLARNIDREERSALQRARSNLHHQLSAFADIPE